MRLLHRFSALSLGLLSLALGGEALAAPGIVTKIGRFPAASLASAPLVSPSPRASASALEKAASSLLLEHIAAARGADLGQATTIELASGDRVVKRPQLHQGVPVAFRGVAVTFGTDDVAEVISSKLEQDLPSTVKPQISAALAAGIASRIAGVDLDPARAALLVWPLPDGPRLVWGIDAPVLSPLPYQPVVLVDAQSGAIVLKYNAVQSLNQANIYPSNPDKSPTQEKVTLPVGTGQKTLQNGLVQSLNCIDTHTTKTLTVMGFPIPIHVCELQQIAKPGTNGDYLSITPAADAAPEDAFSELSMFYHVNRVYSFFRGFQPTLQVDPNPVPTVSNFRFPQGFDDGDLKKITDPNLPLAPLQNAFFAPANPVFSELFGVKGGAMYFGQGPVRDYSYDGDVIYHEFTHAVVNVTLKLIPAPHLDEFGASYAPGAMNEGLSDFFSSALTGDPDVGEYASKDIDPNLTAVRSLSKLDSCPSAIAGEVHQDATLFSGGLWEVRQTLPADQQSQFDAAVFKAMNSSPTGDLGYEDFANLILNAIKVSPLGPPVVDKLSAAFTQRGLLPKCTRVLESTGEELTGPKDLKGLWFAPGTATTGATADTGGYTPGVIQVHQKLQGVNKLTVAFKSIELGGVAGLGMGTPFTPKVLVRFGAAPIQFTYGPLKASADVALVDLTKEATAYSGSVDIPAGATDVYVMVVSTGELDGAFTALKLTAENVPTPSTSVGDATSTSVGSAGGAGGDGAGGGGGEPVEVGGCGCAVPGQDTSGAGAALAALGALGFFAARRRKRA